MGQDQNKPHNPRPDSTYSIQGVVCDVENCVHHDGERFCTAEEINVGPTYAISSADTVCSTFKSK